jgi:hypothetical protein
MIDDVAELDTDPANHTPAACASQFHNGRQPDVTDVDITTGPYNTPTY